MSFRFALLFNNLIPELLNEVLCQMDLKDVLTMRLTCRTFYAKIESHQASIVHCFINRAPLQRLAMLYQPLVAKTPLTLDYLLGLSHRFHVVNHLSHFLATNMMDTIDQMYTGGNPNAVRNLSSVLQPYLLILCHFLETYRTELAKAVQTCDISVEAVRETVHRQVEDHILQQYNVNTLYHVCFLSGYLFSEFEKKLGAPSYAGSVERTVRRWLINATSESERMQLSLLGGLESVYRVITLPKLSDRIHAFRKHLQRLTSPRMDPEPAQRRKHTYRKKTPRFKPSNIIPPLNEETARQICQVLPKGNDFLNATRIAPLFKLGVSPVGRDRHVWEYTRCMMCFSADSDFDSEARVPTLISNKAARSARPMD